MYQYLFYFLSNSKRLLMTKKLTSYKWSRVMHEIEISEISFFASVQKIVMHQTALTFSFWNAFHLRLALVSTGNLREVFANHELQTP